jgi:phosphate transport system permease protein
MAAHPMSALLMRRKTVNAVMLSLTGLCTFIAAGTLLYILGYLFIHGAKSLNLNFFTQLPAPVGETGGGMANAIIGSGKLLLLAMLIGVPIGFLGGVYLAEFGGNTFAFVVRYVTDLLNGVPSIVMGIFAYSLIVLPQKHFSTLAGGMALGVMMIPIAIRSSEEFLRAVPLALREGAMALGASKSKAILTVVIPAAKNGIITGIMLNLARVAGETAPLIFTSFNSRFWSPGFEQATAALPVMIWTYAISPYKDWHEQAWSAGFVLLTLIFAVNVIARIILSRQAHVPR